MKTVLYQYWQSSSSWRVRWALAIKGVAFDSVMVDLRAGEQTADPFAAKNPMGEVPVLAIDGRTLGESVAILEYLDETIPEPRLYPADPFLRARVRQLVELVNSGTQPMQNLVVLDRHSKEPRERKAWARFFNERGLGALEALLGIVAREIGADGPFAAGETLTAADLYLVPQVASARRFGADLSHLPRVLAVEKAALATPHAAAALPENQLGAPSPA